LPHKKTIITDKVFDSNNKLIVKKKTVLICSLDACDYLRYSRIKIVNNEIWIFHYSENEKSIIKKYNLCGKFISEENWNDKGFDDY